MSFCLFCEIYSLLLGMVEKTEYGVRSAEYGVRSLSQLKCFFRFGGDF